jgi:outer membrane protein OmpA-like peptidoglycan-associated protein
VSAQNLVPNGSFEIKPDFDNHDPSNWIKCLKNDTPDFLSFGKTGSYKGQFDRILGGIPPQDGRSYVGIFCYRINPYRGIKDVREFIQIALDKPLLKDSIYNVSLYIALDPESNTAVNNLNIFFAKEKLIGRKEQQLFAMVPQVSFKNSMFDNYEWSKVEYDYKAKGNENFIVLGNFLSDSRLRIRKMEIKNPDKLDLKWNLAKDESAAYYYIDNVKVLLKPQFVQKDPVIEETIVIKNEIEEEFDITKIETGVPIVLRNIFFEFDKDILLPESFLELTKLYNLLSENPDLKILIEGHTDNIGDYNYNMDLSIRRAKAVVDYLISRGVGEDRLNYEGYGYTVPLVDNSSEINRKLNRRVVFRTLE